MRFIFSVVLIMVTACDSPTAIDDRWAVPEEIDFAASLEIDLATMNRTESGLYWQDLQLGSEDAPAVTLDDEIRIHYTLWLPNGDEVDTTIGGTPFQSEVILLIPGVAEGVTGMKRGGVRKLVIRPELAWPSGYGDIPPRTTVIFEVELIAIVM
ncbi:MAG: FKBP-type peptidyl-prolyl cis-trans isomerase [Gemmatimonadetes bacterium]|nr:FKBP-type peptidyl-prolyl cis-trans isomerase [Gemmatimonadota bacterium]